MRAAVAMVFALLGADVDQVLEASRDGFLGSTGMTLDAEPRVSLAVDAATCPALRYRCHSDDMGGAAVVFLCGTHLVHAGWVVKAELVQGTVDPARVEANRDLLVANIHLRD